MTDEPELSSLNTTVSYFLFPRPNNIHDRESMPQEKTTTYQGHLRELQPRIGLRCNYSCPGWSGQFLMHEVSLGIDSFLTATEGAKP